MTRGCRTWILDSVRHATFRMIPRQDEHGAGAGTLGTLGPHITYEVA